MSAPGTYKPELLLSSFLTSYLSHGGGGADCVLWDRWVRMPNGAPLRTHCLFTKGIWQRLHIQFTTTPSLTLPSTPSPGRLRWALSCLFIGEHYWLTCTCLNKYMYNMRFATLMYTFAGLHRDPPLFIKGKGWKKGKVVIFSHLSQLTKKRQSSLRREKRFPKSLY